MFIGLYIIYVLQKKKKTVTLSIIDISTFIGLTLQSYKKNRKTVL